VKNADIKSTVQEREKIVMFNMMNFGSATRGLLASPWFLAQREHEILKKEDPRLLHRLLMTTTFLDLQSTTLQIRVLTKERPNSFLLFNLIVCEEKMRSAWALTYGIEMEVVSHDVTEYEKSLERPFVRSIMANDRINIQLRHNMVLQIERRDI
jgi:hypothetical protein